MANDEQLLRQELVDNLIKEFVGPGSEGFDGGSVETERISESPLKRYALGILYPQKTFQGEDIDINEQLDDTDESIETSSLEDGQNDNDETSMRSIESDDPDDRLISAANQFCPSSYGITFFVSGTDPQFRIKVYAAKYSRLLKEEAFVPLTNDVEFIRQLEPDGCFEIVDNKLFYLSSKSVRAFREKLATKYLTFSRLFDKAKNFHFRGFKREPILLCDTLISANTAINPLKSLLPEEIEIRCNWRNGKDGISRITISVINLNHVSGENSKYHAPENCFYQNRIEVSDFSQCVLREISKPMMLRSSESGDEVLYRNRKIFAAGHGCSVDWDDQKSREKIWSTFVPTYQVPKVESFPERIKRLNLEVFSMPFLAYEKDKEIIFRQIELFVADYSKWVNEFDFEFNNIEQHERQFLKRNQEKCMIVVDRMKKGILILKEDNKAWDAFRLANKAMTIQRYHSEKYLKNPRTINDPPVVFPSDYDTVDATIASWRPFQLAFLLMSIEPTTYPESKSRDIADLIWFPTGGGKTEAYLGVIAFTIFFRRIAYGKQGGGTSVIMRYTLRLLTSQQYERASTLIAACEYLRRSHSNVLGEEAISIGLWVGRDNTPNKQKQAANEVATMINSPLEFKEKNPFQVFYCPWCGTQLLNETAPAKSGYVSSPLFHFRCIEKNCQFNQGLPLQVVDEHLYHRPPTLLFATVDKFARLAWDSECMSFFGLQIIGNKSERVMRPPELILQDELHLISGPLGSLFGIYESIIDYLCSDKLYKPRIVCSTATIKRADEQIRLLFDRETLSFPPSGYDVSNNYFSEEISKEKTPGRLYVGLMSVGITQTSAQVKALSNLLFYNVQVDETIKDSYYSLVCYFNTIKDLGHTASLIDADIHEKIRTLQARHRVIFNRPLWRKELTSREETTELPKILKQLATAAYPSPNAIPILLSTNMFSVGVDISRLNLLLMVGQPKSTSEYIQSTSRVGRSDPGLIVALLDGFRVRDRSHYENFRAFHQSFYRFVEPSGVTPFSEPARRRALHTLLIIVMRQLLGLPLNSDAVRFNRNLVGPEITCFLLNRIKKLDPSELEDARLEWEKIISTWDQRASGDLVYAATYNPFRRRNETPASTNRLMKSFEEKRSDDNNECWPVLNSLRSVDVPCACYLED